MDQKSTNHETAQEINAWAYVEVMGHDQLCGLVSTMKIGSVVMFKIDVPDNENGIAYTKFFNPTSIFSITPTTEEYCRRFAKAKTGMVKNVVPFVPEQPKFILPEKQDAFEDLLSPEDQEDDLPFYE